MLIYGASGHGKVIISALESQNETITGIFDDDLTKKSLDEITLMGKYDSGLNANEKTPFATDMLLTFGALDGVIQDDLEP